MSHGKRFGVQLHGSVKTSEDELELTISPDLAGWDLVLEGKSLPDMSAYVTSMVCRMIPHFSVDRVSIHVECRSCGAYFESDTDAPACNCDG